MDDAALLKKIDGFINDIGISCGEGIVDQHTFLPGVDIVDGAIIYDTLMLDSYGDLLHEAGHVAVLKPEHRAVVNSPDVWGDLSEEQAEVAAIAWSWAALKHLDIPAGVVFHDEGYRGGADHIIDKFDRESYVGVDMLDSFGMTNLKAHNGKAIFPEMDRWLRP